MMTSLFDRLRAALAPRFVLERELGAGGMGVVFLASEPGLGRRVAIKALRPDRASAAAMERFQREARLLARFSHPNVVPIHTADTADGVPYFVMDYVEGRTLADRIAEAGFLEGRECVAVLDDVLAALAAAHQQGIVHRDVKPLNVFLLADRTLLGDFGIAKVTTASDEGLTEPGSAPGTRPYMAPEQFAGVATPATDVYAAGMVFYECLTGRRWPAGADPQGEDWSGVPRALRRVVRVALAPEPTERYPDAGAFRQAVRTVWARRWVPARLAAGAAAIGVLVVLASLILPPPRPGTPERRADVAVLPFAVPPGTDPQTGEDLARLVGWHLEAERLSVQPSDQVVRWWDSASATGNEPPLAAARAAFGSRYVVGGRLLPGAGDVHLQVLDSAGARHEVPGAVGAAGDLRDLGHRLGYQVFRILRPRKAAAYRGSPVITAAQPEALAALLAGERAFWSEAWVRADSLYARAVALDSTLALARWRLLIVRRWRRIPHGVDVARMYATYANQFTEVEGLLIAAELVRPGPEQLAIYERAVRAAGPDPYPDLLFGAELFHRGPLFGVALDSSAAALTRATAKNPYLAPAQMQLAWVLIRTGDTTGAAAAVEQYRQIAAPATEVDFRLPELLQLAWVERFDPARAENLRATILQNPADPGAIAGVARALRWAPSLGVPATERALGRLLATAPVGPGGRANAHVASGLALAELGRGSQVPAQFDSAALLTGDDRLVLQAAQWRILPAVLGMWRAGPGEDRQGRQTLRRLAATPGVGERAAWTLAVDALSRGDTAGAKTWMERVRQGAAGPDRAVRLALLEGFAAARRGQFREGLAQLAPVYPATRAGDAFARSLLHLWQGAWLLETGDSAAADRAWRWYLAADVDGWPTGPAQAGEVDWALGTWGRDLRLRLARARGDQQLACRLRGELVERWASADPPLAQRARDAAALTVCRTS